MYTFIHPIFILTDSTGNKLNNLEFEQCDISEIKTEIVDYYLGLHTCIWQTDKI